MTIMETRHRICRKCLTAEMDQTQYFQNMYTYIANLDEQIKSGEVLYESRLDVCKQCDLLADGMCRGCGCFVELRAAVAANACPYNKW